MKKGKGLLGLLLLLGVGFAAISVTLYVNGTVSIKPDSDNFNQQVKFASVAVDSDSTTAGTTASIEDNGKKIVFSTHALKTIGETVTISYSVINESQYSAKLGEITCEKTEGDDVWNSYLDLTPANGLNDVVLAKNATSDTDTLVVTMKKSYVGNEKTYKFTCTLGATAQED